MVLWKFTLRELKSRPGRATLTLLSIVIAVAAVVAVKVSTATTRQAYQDMYAKLAGRAALEVVPEGEGTYDESLAGELEKIPGVKAAVPVLNQRTNLYTKQHGRVLIMAMGIDPLRDAEVRDYELAAGEFFHGDDGALMEIGFAKALGIEVGDEVRIMTRQPSQPVQSIRVIGLLAPKGAAQFSQGGTMFLTLRTAQQLFRAPHSVNFTSLVLDPSADAKRVQEAVAGVLPTGLAPHTPQARTQLGSETLQSLDQGLGFAYTLTLVLATIVILNTFLMNVGERRRQLAILRALGTTRGQIMGMLLREGLLMGMVGTLVGLLFGLAGAFGLSVLMAGAYNASVTSLEIGVEPFILAGLMGPGIALVAMFVPAYLAGKVTPLEGMRPLVTETGRPVSPWLSVTGIVAVVLTGVGLVAAVLRLLPIQMATPIGVAYTVSLILLIPAVLDPLSRLCAAVLSPVFRTEGKLAHRQVVRRRTRSTLTVGVLYVSLSAGIGLGTAILNNVDDVRTWQTRTFVGDYIIRAIQPPDLASATMPVMREELMDEFAKTEGVAGIDAIRYVHDVTVKSGHNKGEDQLVGVALRDFPANDRLQMDLKVGDQQEVRKQLREGDAVIGTVLAHKMGVDAGDTITLQTREGPKSVRVAGLTNEYWLGGMVVYMDRAVGKKLLAADGITLFIIRATPDALAEVGSSLKAICDRSGLLLQSFAELRQRLDSLMSKVIAGLWGIMALGLVVAGFAVANTLTMNVLEQTREIAMLRVVAMTRHQVRKTILAQAAILGLLGVTLGVVSGAVASYTMNLCTPAVTGRPIDFVFHPGLLIGTYLVAIVIILIAAWLPARRATRLNLLIALQYE